MAEEGGSSEAAWLPVLAVPELPEGKGVRVSVGDTDVLVVRAGEAVLATGNRCTHQGAPLHKGVVRFSGSLTTVTCPVHGSTFDLGTGRVMRGPATQPLPAYESRITGETIEVRPKG